MLRLDRRRLLGALAATAPLAVVPGAWAQECAVFDKARQAAITPAEALDRLMEGNARLLAGRPINCDLLGQIKATAGGQAPFAAVVGCIDSRVPPELVLDQRIGDVFVARVAGNFVNTDIIGSLEFATRVAGAKLIMVLGHSECGAIKGAIDNVELGNLTAMLGNIRPAVDQTQGVAGERNAKNGPFVQAVAETNARLAATMLVERSIVLQQLVSEGSLVVVAAMHDIGTGKVTLLAG